MSKKVQHGDKVKVHYTGKHTDGKVFDSSRPRGQTLDFTVWAGQMIKGFDQAMMDMMIGESKTVELLPELAYGPHNPEHVQEIELTMFGSNIPEVGKQYQMGHHSMRIIEITETHAKADFNHELAGKTLVFDIELVDIV